MKNAQIRLSYLRSLLELLTAMPTLPWARARALDASGLDALCYRLMVKAMTATAGSTAQCFLPVLEHVQRIDPAEWDVLQHEPGGRKVLVDNTYLKVVMIRWEPGAVSTVHAHPQGGGIIQVLEGEVEESRYWNGDDPIPYAVTTYHRWKTTCMDDSQGYHSVRNPGAAPAVTLHAYLKYG